MRTKEDRDVVLGKALVRAFQEECEEKHPGLEELAALIDGKLKPDERTRMMGHVASCDRCYEIFSMSSEMVKEQQGVSRVAHANMPPVTGYRLLLAKVQEAMRVTPFRVPIAVAAGLLIAVVALFFAYKDRYVPSSELIALKADPQKEAPRLSAPSETREPVAPMVASVPEEKREEMMPREKSREEKPAAVFYAEVAVNDAIDEFLSDVPDDRVTDKKKIGELVAMLVDDNKAIGKYAISEIHIERGETLMRSTRSSAERAKITIKNGVLTIKLVE